MMSLLRGVVAVAGVAAMGAVLWQGVAPALALDAESRRGEQIDSRMRLAVARHGAREAVLDDLLGGRLTLVQAAERFGDLNDVSPGATAAVRGYFGCESDEERLCHQVILCVRSRVADQSPDGGEVLARLESEMAARFGHGRTTG